MAKKTALSRTELEMTSGFMADMKFTSVISKNYFGDPESKPYRDRFDQLKKDREHIEPVWKQVKKYFAPGLGRYLDGDSDTPELVNMDDIADSAVLEAAQTAASGLHGGLTSPTTNWFDFYVGNYDRFQDESRDVRDWVGNAQLCTRDILSRSNYYSEGYGLNLNSVTFGTASMLIMSDYETIVRYRALDVGEAWLAQDNRMEVNTLYRKYSMAARDILERYGPDNCSDKVRDLVEKSPYKRLNLIQCIQPWGYFGLFGKKEGHDFKYEDVRYVESDSDEAPILYRGGYRSKPFIAVRWAGCGDYVYSLTSPAILALPDARNLMYLTERNNMALAWAADPPWQVPTKYAGKGIAPGSIIPVDDSQGRPVIQPGMLPSFDHARVGENRQYLRQSIENKFFNKLWRMIQDRTRQTTATEIMQLIEEKSNLLGPFIYRFTSEGHGPLLLRTLDIAIRNFKMLPPAPEELSGQDIQPYFTSALAIAQRQAALSGMDLLLATASQAASMNLEALDVVDFDAIIRAKGEASNLPADVIRSKDEVEEMRAAKAEAMRQQQNMMAVQKQADVAQTLGNTPVDENNALGMLAGMKSGAGL